ASVSDGDTIQFNLTYPATITLTTGQLVVNNNVTISGPGANNLNVDGNANGRVFYISPGKTVTIDGLTITHGSTPVGANFPDNAGAGIYNDQATLTVINSTLSGNSATNGGGLYNYLGTLNVANSTLSGNSGGSIYNNVATLIITNSTLSG